MLGIEQTLQVCEFNTSLPPVVFSHWSALQGSAQDIPSRAMHKGPFSRDGGGMLTGGVEMFGIHSPFCIG
jgi:hypothetical protein